MPDARMYGTWRSCAAFFFASSPRRSYLPVVASLEWPASFFTVDRSAPASRQSETKLRRRSCGEYGATPASDPRFRVIQKTAWSLIRWWMILSPLLTAWKSAPAPTLVEKSSPPGRPPSRCWRRRCDLFFPSHPCGLTLIYASVWGSVALLGRAVGEGNHRIAA